MRERLVRLGLPSLLYMVVIQPFIVYVLLQHPRIPDRPPLAVLYGRYLASERVLRGNGPLWFALALLGFCALLAGWRALRKQRRSENLSRTAAPGATELFGFAGLVVISTFLVRLVQPMGTNVLNFQLCFFPQYIAAFIAGVVAGGNGWLVSLATSHQARVAGWMGVIGGPLLFATIAWLGGPPPETGPVPYAGGWNVRALGFAAWEQLAGLGIGLGLLAFFHSHLNGTGRMAAWLSERAFGAYVLHPPILVALTLILRPVGGHPLFRTLLLTVTGLVISFLVADVLKRLPGFQRIL